ncbi:MAG: OsmC family peroxiredoxin [Bauldia litoralis]
MFHVAILKAASAKCRREHNERDAAGQHFRAPGAAKGSGGRHWLWIFWPHPLIDLAISTTKEAEMAVVSKADAQWNGSLKEGGGEVAFGTFRGSYSFASRFETGAGTNPEQLIAAAHAGCYSMQLSGVLTAGGNPPTSIDTTAEVTIEAGVGITGIKLVTEAAVPGISAEAFAEAANKAKEICPVSKALAAVENITLEATLKS